MKKENNGQKKLSLKKVQLMKINEMKTINGGYGGFESQLGLNGNDDDPLTPIRQTVKP
jgi:hypothetical protein